jgi:hypothetical protein
VIPTILIVRPFLLLTGEGVANHRDGGRDPTELVSTVQPANTARPVETTKTIIPQPVMGGRFGDEYPLADADSASSPRFPANHQIQVLASPYPPEFLRLTVP